MNATSTILLSTASGIILIQFGSFFVLLIIFLLSIIWPISHTDIEVKYIDKKQR